MSYWDDRKAALDALKPGDYCVVIVNGSGPTDRLVPVIPILAKVLERTETTIRVRTEQASCEYTFNLDGYHPDLRLEPSLKD